MLEMKADYEKIQHAGAMAWDYLRSIKKTDLAKLSPDEWGMFIFCIIKAYHEKPITK